MVPIRRIPLKTVELDFSDDGYPGFTATARLNVPVRLYDEFQAGDEKRTRAAVLVAFPEWDFVDDDGEKIPHTIEGIGLIPLDLYAAMITQWAEALAGKTAIPPKADDSSSPASPSEPEASREAPSPKNMPESS
jgi:hypothetical protein